MDTGLYLQVAANVEVAPHGVTATPLSLTPLFPGSASYPPRRSPVDNRHMA
jgi:hypothetical protein